MKKHIDQGNLLKEGFVFLMVPEGQEPMVAGNHSSKQAGWLVQEAEDSHLELPASKGEWELSMKYDLKPQSLPH